MAMSKKAWWIIGGSVAGVALIGAVIIIHRRAMKRVQAPKLSQFKRNIVELAEMERDRWAGRNEKDPAMSDTLIDYWKRGTGRSVSRRDVQSSSFQSRMPWSAATISWIMKVGGAGDDFRYSASHSNYIVQAKKNRLANNDVPFKLYRLSEYAPQVGDIVCRSRSGAGATYDNIRSGMTTHCDIVTDVGLFSLNTIGGNVKQTVSDTPVSIDENGKVTQRDYFAVIKVDK